MNVVHPTQAPPVSSLVSAVRTGRLSRTLTTCSPGPAASPWLVGSDCDEVRGCDERCDCANSEVGIVSAVTEREVQIEALAVEGHVLVIDDGWEVVETDALRFVGRFLPSGR